MNCRFFDIKEFDSPDKPGSGKKMDAKFLAKLDEARNQAGIPFVITSGYRTKNHNREVGGVKDSAHTTGHAVDIAVSSSRQRYVIMMALMEQGFNRIGVGENFIHVDDDPSKPENVMWDYYKDSHVA